VTAGAVRWVPVWPLWQRLLHLTLALAVLTALVQYEGGAVHEAAGYVALVAATLRLLLGWAGPQAARFRSFVRGLRETWVYARQVRDHDAPRYLNHNPLGAWMVVCLVMLCVLAGASGALYVTDRYWGEAWLITLHAVVAWPLVVLVPLHVAGVLHASREHHENLAAAMWHGRKPARAGDHR
jgi:cytochrome b